MREIFEIGATQNNWSVREFSQKFNSALYGRFALSKNKDDIKQLAKKDQIIERPTDLLKSHYVLEFLDLKQDHRYAESDLETIINKLEHLKILSC
ncbi:hypothetical protein [Chryseobacterium sp. ISL-6]|uniref:hypothetical protein n=1 Tax=Chryseobacterium sp. ISL-6 TaxID=2819143 RepID=UPI001BEB978D|nr:hypothetical protein [Chryseobacterium sp. ISL-6]MBT2620341.1 YhcG family protein [Chryseobacterium sp. ISL-6]